MAQGIAELHDRLREAVRSAEGRDQESSAAVVDATVALTSRGFDAGKEVNGRKRRLLTDTLGLLLAVLVTPASTTDRDAARVLLAAVRDRFGRLSRVLGRRRLHRPPRRLECGTARSRARHRPPKRRHPRLPGPAPPLGRGEIFRLVSAQPAPGPGLRAAHRHQRSLRPVVDDHAREPSPGHSTPGT
ncbi:transposase [Streptomyces sp. NPDC086766]|uniref:transposase n=1 Tax=Streptomyces sp. NPDC086766 TaxID=3365754 RepID=UPI0037F1BB4B